MSAPPSVQITPDHPIADAELTALLTECYVGGGFTDAVMAASAFAPSAVRARGDILHCRGAGGALTGVVILVPPASPARRFATAREAEVHLLAVHPTARRSGVGRALMSAVIAEARARGYQRLLLWTQPAMSAARALYPALGFSPRPERDFERDGKRFLFHELEL
jgi:GNAT superfamily N-acetyltransferase